MNHLKYSITAFQQAVEATSKTEPDYARYLNNADIVLWKLSEQTTCTQSDPDRSISTYELAVKLIPDDLPDFPRLLDSLTNALRTPLRAEWINERHKSSNYHKQISDHDYTA